MNYVEHIFELLIKNDLISSNFLLAYIPASVYMIKNLSVCLHLLSFVVLDLIKIVNDWFASTMPEEGLTKYTCGLLVLIKKA